MYQRPKPGETEEDLLRLQKEFQQYKAENKIKPAASFIGENPVQDQINVQKENNIQGDAQTEITEQLANTFEAIPNVKLNNIIEKKDSNVRVPSFKFQKGKGFPQAKRRDLSILAEKGSIFSQEIKKIKKTEYAMEIDGQPVGSSLVIKENRELSQVTSFTNIVDKTTTTPANSYVLTGTESKQIHEDNLNFMKSMSEHEILEEQKKLMSTMDPALISFLKAKRKKEHLQNRNPTIKEQNEAGEDIKIEEIETPNELLMHPSSEKWLNFDTLETNKLAWMKNVDIPKIDKTKPFEARFDFEGWLLPYSEPEISEKNRALYHHGEEPGRPGYTLQELFQLSRSNVIQQKNTALNCIANILSLNSTGVYDDIIDLPLEQIFFVLRFCLDDNTPSVLTASIRAMRNLFFSQVDETCLDCLLGFGLCKIQPILAVDHEREDDITVNDQQLAEKNLIRCLARTDVLIRIRYIINTVKPPLETIVYCIDILIRLARDSDLVVSKIINCENLLESIIKNFVPNLFIAGTTNNAPYGLPLLQAIKLLRVLSSRSKSLALKLTSKFKVMDSISFFLSNDIFSANVNGLRLQTECLHFWGLLICYNLSLDYFSVLEPVLRNILNFHFKNTNLDTETTFVRQGHLSALLVLLGNVAQSNYSCIQPIVNFLLENCMMKWFTQFSNFNRFECGKLQIISSLMYCLSSLRPYQQDLNIDDAVGSVIQSYGFKIVTENLRNGSMFLNNYQTLKSSSNLKRLESAAWHTMDHIVPVLQTNSCLPFLASLSRFIDVSNNTKLKTQFLTHPNLQNYFNSLRKLERYHLSTNWFSRIESFLLMNVLKSSTTVRENLDTSVFYELAVKCLCIFNAEQKEDIEYILENVIFCSKFYPSDLLMQHLDISQRNENLEVSLNNLNEILEVYVQVLGLKKDIPDFQMTCCLDVNIGNVIPIDWVYTPILVMYSNQQKQDKEKIEEKQQVFTIKNCLRWILIYETYFPSLAVAVNPTDRFCRLSCVFLGNDSLFLIKEIHDLLQLCFANVITKCESELNFQKEIQGLANFQDFYTQLLEQYQGVSYGDVLFGNVILVPLAQKHDVQYKKTLWSEYLGAVQTFNVSNDQCLCDLKLFLEPEEEDISLLTCYRRAIATNTVRKHSVLYEIAKYHVNCFIAKQK